MLEGRHIALIEDDEIMGASLLHRLELEGARVAWHKTIHRALGPCVRRVCLLTRFCVIFGCPMALAKTCSCACATMGIHRPLSS